MERARLSDRVHYGRRTSSSAARNRQILAGLAVSIGIVAASLVAAAALAFLSTWSLSDSLKSCFGGAGIVLLLLSYTSSGGGRVALRPWMSKADSDNLSRLRVWQLERSTAFFAVTLATGLVLFVAAFLLP